LASLSAALAHQTQGGGASIQYKKLHKLLAEGNFVLSACEGFREGVHTSFYDLYRVAGGKIQEHWDTSEAIPARSEWKNENGKF
jgi:predicted SnoaL-like aldol condensation-catalyzing enzyme